LLFTKRVCFYIQIMMNVRVAFETQFA